MERSNIVIKCLNYCYSVVGSDQPVAPAKQKLEVNLGLRPTVSIRKWSIKRRYSNARALE